MDKQTDRETDKTDRQATYKDLGVSMATGVKECMVGRALDGWMEWMDDG